jgi:fatty acid desaturase
VHPSSAVPSWCCAPGRAAPPSPQSPPPWALRRSDRAVPALPVPALAELGGAHVLAGQRRIAAFFLARVAAGLALFALCLARGWWLGLGPAMWVVYGGTLTAVHHLVHGPLGCSDRTRRRLLTALGAVVAESGHALEVTHLTHHDAGESAPGVAPTDPEGYIEHVPWRRMPLEAIRFRYRLMGWGLRYGDAVRRRRIRAEVSVHGVAHVLALALWPLTWWPAAYLGCVAVASAAFTLMAGKGPQTNWGRPVASPLVRVRAGVASLLLFSHDRHLEHHAYPEVPMARLRRLDPLLDPILDRLPLVEVRLP